MITPASALKFSMWLAATHPQAFAAVLRELKPLNRPSGLGAVNPRNYARGRFGALGDQEGLQSLGVDDINTTFDTSLFSDPVLQDINFSADDWSGPQINLAQVASAVDDSGGFWSSLGSGLSSIGGGLVSAIGTVAKAVTSPPVLASVGTLAAAVIKNDTNVQQAQLQQAVLQAQLQRTATGAGAAPVVYSTNPSTGRQQPYYYNAASGQYQLTQPTLLSSTGSLSTYLPYIVIGGGLLLAVVLTRPH
jgi:hypothetical protein